MFWFNFIDGISLYSDFICPFSNVFIFWWVSDWPDSIVLCFPVQAKLLLRMLAYLSESISNAFMVDELRGRIAQMLGYFLDHLVGRKSKDLKVCGVNAFGDFLLKYM